MLEQKTIDGIGQVTRDLLHPRFMRLLHDARDIDSPRSEVDDKQHVVSNEPSPRDRFNREEVHGCDGASMGAKKGAPANAFAALWCGLQAGIDQDALDGVASQVMTEIAECTTDARVTPRWIVGGEAQHDLYDVARAPWLAAASSGAAVVFASDEAAIPSEQCVRRDQGIEFRERLASELARCASEPASLRVGEAHALVAKLLSEHGVLGEQILGETLVVTRHPARDCEQEDWTGRLDMMTRGSDVALPSESGMSSVRVSALHSAPSAHWGQAYTHTRRDDRGSRQSFEAC